MTPRPLFLIAAASAAPLFWLGQVMLGYWVTAQGCYPGDAPRSVPAAGLMMAVWCFDAVALLAALAGGAISLAAWRGLDRRTGHDAAMATGEGRTRFLAIWSLYASLWFFCAILFNTIATLTVPPCAT
jgi:hypothetical protein